MSYKHNKPGAVWILLIGLLGFWQCTADLQYIEDDELLSSLLLACNISETRCYNTVSLDSSFGNKGIITLNNPAGNSDDSAFALAFNSQNRITLGGSSIVMSGDTDSLIVRLLDDGSLDSSFTGSGATTQDTSGAAQFDFIMDLQIDSLDRVVMTGQTIPGANRDVFAARLNSDGSFDTTFNGTGLRRIDNINGGSQADIGAGLALDSSDRLIIAGHSLTTLVPLDLDHFIMRLLNTGASDAGFGTAGVAHIPHAPLWDILVSHSVALDQNERIVMAGQRNNGTDNTTNSNFDMAVYRLLSNGTPDTSFNGTGYQVINGTAGGNSQDVPYDVVVDATNTVYVAGTSYNGSSYDAVIWSFAADGSLNSSFGTNGAIVLPDSGLDEVARAIALDASNRPVACGGVKQADDTVDMIAWRVTTGGVLDETFSGGSFQHNSAAGGNGDDICNDLAFDQNQKLVIVGSSHNGSNADLAVWRLLVQ